MSLILGIRVGYNYHISFLNITFLEPDETSIGFESTPFSVFCFLSKICFVTPTSSSSTLCFRTHEVSIYFASKLVAFVFPSAKKS